MKLIFDLPSVSGNLWKEIGGVIHWPLQTITTSMKIAWMRLVYEKVMKQNGFWKDPNTYLVYGKCGILVGKTWVIPRYFPDEL